ncbi:unnamed protein product [Rhizoctonia solani]|uniref:WIBG Mago-binding domain-containing protein n=1 Tax=Rhizoctonia solani TaxID=456999 RepID=A0A8H3DVF9_9AGAM|nr:unnamed protein product [Rhizoctonia solani]
MSLPPLNPDQTPSGIALDPRTLERVVPSTRRADGSVRKELKIRPGFTPQEDVSRFRGTRQQAADRSALPKGHIVGWVAPSSETKPKPKPKPKPGSLAAAGAAAAADTDGMSKAQKKNAKRAEKRAEKRSQPVAVKDNWDDDDEDEGEEPKQGKPASSGADNSSDSKAESTDIDTVTKEIGELKV